MPSRASLAKAVALSLLAATSSTAGPAVASVTATAAPLQAFVLAGAPDSLADLQAHARDIGVVYPTYLRCALGGGRLVGEDTGAVTAYADLHHIAVMPRFNCQDGATVHAILVDPRVRARTIAALAHIAQTPAYAGVNLDLENDIAGDRRAFTSFVRALARELHAGHKQLSIDVDGVTHDDPMISTGLYDDRALAALADYVFVMAWGTHWEGSGPGPIAPLPYVASVARYLASLPHANRFVLGAPMYGLDWPVFAGAPGRRGPRASALQDAGVLALADATSATPARDRAVDEMTFAYKRAGVTHRVWYIDARAAADRLRIARAHGLGVGVWRLGVEDQGLWSSTPVLEGLT